MRRNGKGGKPLDYAQIGDDDPLLPVAAKAASSSAVNIFSVVQSLIVISLVAVAVTGGVYASIGFNILNDHERRITYFEGDPRFLQITSEIDRVKQNVTTLQSEIALISNSTSITMLIDSINGKTMGLMANLTDLQNADSDFLAWFSQEVLWRIGNDTQISTNVTILQTQIGLLSNSTDFAAMLDGLTAKTMGLMMNVSSVQQAIAASNITSIQIDVTQVIADLSAEIAARMAEDALEAAFRIGNDTQIVNDLAAETMARVAADAAEEAARIANDTMTIQMFQQTVKFVNSLPPTGNNINIIAGNSGIQIGNSGSTVSVANSGVIQINTQSADGAGTFLVNGASGIGVTNGPANLITVDGSVIETAVNNLDMTVAGQAAQLLNQTSINTDLYDLISNLALSGNMVAQMLNGTTLAVNETIMELITRIQVVELQNALLSAQLTNLTTLGVPIGAKFAFAGASNNVPSGFLLCDGTVLSQSAYPVLYSVIGCAYCPAFTCSVGTFCLPDLQGRVPVGQKVADTNFGLRGQQSGAATHTLLSTEMPSHTHTINVNDPGHAHTVSTDPGHVHDVKMTNSNGFNQLGGNTFYDCSIYSYTGFGSPSVPGTGQYANVWFSRNSEFPCNSPGITFFNAAQLSGSHTHTLSSETTGATATATSSGSGAAHNNVQPSLTVGGWIIRVDT